VVNVKTDYLGRTVQIDGATTKYNAAYWPDGRLRSSTDELERITTYDYDPADRLSTVNQPAAVFNVATTVPITSFAYTVDGLLSTITDPLGRVTTLQYDAGGRKSRQTSPDPDGPGALLASYEIWRRDSLGNVILQGNAFNDPSTVPFSATNQPEKF